MRPERGYRVSKQTLHVHGNIKIRLFNKALIKEVGKQVIPLKKRTQVIKIGIKCVGNMLPSDLMCGARNCCIIRIHKYLLHTVTK